MSRIRRSPLVGAAACLALLVTPSVSAQEAAFHEAYFLQRDSQDYAGAAALYEKVIAHSGTSGEMRAKARAGLAACREELVSADFAALMPPDPWLYVELSNPGEELRELLDGLGLMRRVDEVRSGGSGRQLQISPALIDGLFDLRGAAVAITGFDPRNERPHGVVVLHPGDLELVRGLIETVLPAGADAVSSIEDTPTYALEGGLFVSLTERMIVLGTQKTQIRGVLRRLHGESRESLATSSFGKVLKQRGDALLFACLNPKPLLPMMQMAASQSQEAAMGQLLLDPESLETIVVRAGVENNGVGLQVGMDLSEGHENMAFHFVRLPAVEHDLIKRVPEGAAALVALGLNPEGPANPNNDPGVSIMDFGRELFGNLRGIALYAMPTDGPAPRIGAVLQVNDPAASGQLWSQMLMLASLAGSGPAAEQESFEHEGASVAHYSFPNNGDVYRASSGNQILLATDRDTLERSLRTVHGAPSVFEDAGLSPVLGELSRTHSMFLAIHAGRAAELAAAFENEGVHEALQAARILSQSALSLGIEHDPVHLQLRARFHGLPDVSELVSQQLNLDFQHQSKPHKRKQVAKQAPSIENQLLALAHATEEEVTAQLGALLHEVHDPNLLNRLSWYFLTNDRHAGRMDFVALHLATRANELTDRQNWAYVDTMALALHRQGRTHEAIEWQQRAVELASRDEDRNEALLALAHYEESAETAAIAQ